MFFTACFVYFEIIQTQTGQTIYRKPHCYVTKLKSKFLLVLSLKPGPGAPLLKLA